MTQITGGAAVVEFLEKNEVEFVIGLIGSSTLEILDALYESKKIKYIGCRDERNGSIMADAYGRISGKHGVFLAGQSGPGNVNSTFGSAQAKLAHSPLVILSGDVSTKHKGLDTFQEIDQQTLFEPITKKSFTVNTGAEINSVLKEAFEVAITPKMGSVNINLPRDVMGETDSFKSPEHYQLPKFPEINLRSLQKAAELLSNAKKPVIVVGQGIKNYKSHEVVLSLAELINSPCVSSAGNQDALPHGHPLYAGMAGPRGNQIASKLLKEADVILVLGSRISFNTTMFSSEYINEEAKIIHCEIDKISIGRYFKAEVELHADATSVAENLLELLKDHQIRKEVNEWSNKFKSEYELFLNNREKEADISSVPIKPSGLFKTLRQVIPKDAIITVDAGTWCLRAVSELNYYEPISLVTPGDFGAIGFSFAAGLGCKLAKPDREVISLHGDGGFAFCLADLATSVEYGLNTKTIVMNSKSWGAEKSYVRDYFDSRFLGTDISSPPFDKIAKLYGLDGYKVEKISEVKGALEASLAIDKPAIIEVAVDEDSLYSFRRDSFQHKLEKK